MLRRKALTCLLFGWTSICYGVPAKQTVRTVSSADMLHWSAGLLIVLAIFLFCVWALRKLGGFSGGSGKMRVVGGLSLGMREKIVLLQVGKKQLILGVTPGRIETLHVLEEDECLVRDESSIKVMDSGFAQKLMQAMKGQSDE